MIRKRNKENSNHRASYPGDMPGKNPQVITSKQDGSAVKTVKDNKEQKVKKKHPERRSSNPMAEALLKDSQVVDKPDNNVLETVPEKKNEKSKRDILSEGPRVPQRSNRKLEKMTRMSNRTENNRSGVRQIRLRTRKRRTPM